MLLKRVAPGDAITAEGFNRLADVLNNVREPVLPGSEIAVQVPWVLNTSDVDLEPFQCIQLDSPLFPDDAKKLADFRDLGSWLGIKPTAAGLGSIAILATEAKIGKLGRIFRGPIVPARVNITHAWIDTCDLEVNTHILKTKLEGSARILWKDTATGAYVRCMVQLGQLVDRFYWGVSQGVITAGGTGTVRIDEPGGAGNTTIVAKLQHEDDGTNIADDTDVRVWFSQLDKSWHVDGAACEPN